LSLRSNPGLKLANAFGVFKLHHYYRRRNFKLMHTASASLTLEFTQGSILLLARGE